MQPIYKTIHTLSMISIIPLLFLISGCAGTLGSMRSDIALNRAENMYAKGDYAGASNQYRTAALAGSPYGQYMLGRMYAQGQGVSENQSEAVSWTRMAAQNGYPAADYEMGLRYLAGDGVSINPEQAVFHFRRAADKEHALSMYHLGFAHAVGAGVEPSVSEALRWFRLADSYGFPVEDDLLSESGIEPYVRQAKIKQAEGDVQVPDRQERLLDTSIHNDAVTIQSRLAELGYYKMKIDGLWGPGSKRALKNFQKANGLESSGEWDMESQRKLLSGTEK